MFKKISVPVLSAFLHLNSIEILLSMGPSGDNIITPVSMVAILVFDVCASTTVSGPFSLIIGSFAQDKIMLLQHKYTSAVQDDGKPKKSVMEMLTIMF